MKAKKFKDMPKIDFGKEHNADRASLRGIAEIVILESKSEEAVAQIMNTVADCRKCGGFAEFTKHKSLERVGMAEFETMCWKCGHEDGFTSRVEVTTLGGLRIQVTWQDKSDVSETSH